MRVAKSGKGASADSCRDRRIIKPIELSYDDAVGLLCGASSFGEVSKESPIVLRKLTLDQFRHLVRLADPAYEVPVVEETFVPGVAFRGEGHTVATRRLTYRGDTITPAGRLRPAIIAANVYGVEVRWHEEAMEGPLGERYVREILGCVGASGNDTILYELLNRDAGLFLEVLGDVRVLESLGSLIDSRVVRSLTAVVSAGTDMILESLARVSRAVVSADIDGVLALLWSRWIGRFEGWEVGDVGDLSHDYWRAFTELTGHPRFDRIGHGYEKLARLLYSPRLSWFRREQVVRVLLRDARSYIHLERVRFDAEDWVHRYEDEMDCLEWACDRLFSETR